MPGFVNYKKGALDSQHRDKVYQLLAHGRWFSPAYSTTKAGRHDIAEILLKMALNTTNHKINHCMLDSRQWRGIYHSFTQSEQIFSYRSQWRIQGGGGGGGALGASRLVNVTIWLLIEWFIIDLCDESKRKYKLISLY